MNQGQLKDAERRALNILDSWIETTGVISKGSSYYYEMQGVIEDAVKCGAQAAVYKTLNVDAAKILDNITRKTEIRRTVEMKHVDTDCMLANIMGLRPIEHDCNPRVILERKVLRATRGREKVYVSGGWMEGL